jgi:hypothetical protein
MPGRLMAFPDEFNAEKNGRLPDERDGTATAA